MALPFGRMEGRARPAIGVIAAVATRHNISGMLVPVRTGARLEITVAAADRLIAYRSIGHCSPHRRGKGAAVLFPGKPRSPAEVRPNLTRLMRVVKYRRKVVHNRNPNNA